MSAEGLKNHGPTFKFHVLYTDLFDPLIENRKKPTAAQRVRGGRKVGPHGLPARSPHEERRNIIAGFFSRWRQQVGNNIYPALRLILPDKDRDRAMYGLKEKVLARYLVKVMKIDKNSEDAYSLINWKRPGQTSQTAGDFAERVRDVVSKRAFRIEPGNLTIEDVNNMLGELSAESKEENQLPIIEQFYQQMNADEMMWLIRVILRNMRVGATEKTFLEIWHPDAEALFNICSSLKRVCEELYKPEIRLEKDERGVSLMACYQPQLAFFNAGKQSSFQYMVASMKMTEDDQEFWIEEKLDGERMQLHMDTNISDGEEHKRFKFWSRKAKDYTYLYGESFEGYEGAQAALTPYLKHAFTEGVDSIILDGEMITWDPALDVMVPFGTLKTAALSEITGADKGKTRPFYRVFDILYLNGTDLTRYTLRDRRKALEASIVNVHRRMEILDHTIGTNAEDVEARLREVVEQASEGLVIKNPRSSYKLADRNDDWIKVKPEYMNEFGESLDCVIIGGYYGSGHRGGMLSSFLCGLRDDKKSRNDQKSNATDDQNEQSPKFLSFFKVGGGLTRDEYKFIQHQTEGKWHNWDPKRPPSDLIELAGGMKQIERPDQWINPSDSIVVEVRAASVNPTDDYAIGLTLRFPRFARFRPDKDWRSALSIHEFLNLRDSVEEEHKQNIQKRANDLAGKRSKGPSTRSKKPLTIAGYNTRNTNNVKVAKEKSDVFSGVTVFIMTESTHPIKRSKLELEELVKVNGGKIVQTPDIKSNTQIQVICIAERRTVKVASLIKRGTHPIVKPVWLSDCIEQGRKDFAHGLHEILLPYELDRHVFFAPDESIKTYESNADSHGDSYARDTSVIELKDTLFRMNNIGDLVPVADNRLVLEDLHGQGRGTMFAHCKMYFVSADDDRSFYLDQVKRKAQFARAKISNALDDTVTHVVVGHGALSSDVKRIRKDTATRKALPRMVKVDWINACWEEHTRIDEEKYAVIA